MTVPTVYPVKRPLSGAASGNKGIKVAATSSGAPTTIHTAQSGTAPGCMDEIWLYAVNNDSTSRILSLGVGGVAGEDTLNITIGPQGDVPICIMNGWALQNALVVAAWCTDAANVISIFGFVNRITEV